MTYFLSPGPRSCTVKPGIWPATSMIPDTPWLCRASPEIAWIEAGVSSTLVALNLLAVTVTSSNTRLESDDGASSAACATPGRTGKETMPASEPSTEAAMMRDTVLDTVDTVRSPVSQTVGPGSCERKCARTVEAFLVVVIDAGIVPGADHADDIHAVSGGGLEGMQLFAG